MNITLFWKPKPDITLYELAQCLKYATQMVRPTPEAVAELSLSCGRHFEAVYDQSDEQSVKWVCQNIKKCAECVYAIAAGTKPKHFF